MWNRKRRRELNNKSTMETRKILPLGFAVSRLSIGQSLGKPWRSRKVVFRQGRCGAKNEGKREKRGKRAEEE